MKKFILYFFLLTFLGLLTYGFYDLGYTRAINAKVAQNQSKPFIIDEKILWSLIQNWRLENNLQPYTKDQNTCNLAYIRTTETQTDNSHNGFWNHTKDFLNNGLAENLYYGSDKEQDILNGWLNSPKHRENLDYPYTHSCIHCLNNKCVQIFANY